MYQDLLQTHLARYPEMRLSDVYRLLHQALFGSGEAVSNKKSTREWLEHEWRINPPAQNAPLLEALNSQWTRLYLCPYQAAGGQLDPLLEAVLRVGKLAKPPSSHMDAAWGEFATTQGNFFPAREVALFGRVYAAQGWPNILHSPEYIRAYRPAYRLLTTDEAHAILGLQGINWSRINS